MKNFSRRLVCPILAILIGAVLSGCGGGILTVNTADDNDDGACNAAHCSLREAINKANELPVRVVINFNIGGGGPQTIRPGFGLPIIQKPVTIDGTTQPGYVSQPLIELDGSLAQTMGGDDVFDGLMIGGGDTTVKALAINRFEGAGIVLYGNGNNRIVGCRIGTDPAGTTAAGNGTFHMPAHGGILILSGEENIIGGTGKNAGNVVSANWDVGIRILSDNNSVINNLIGTNADGTAALGNQGDGILVAGGGNTIGGNSSMSGNLISGNLGHGVSISLPTNSVQGNRIGLDVTGTAGLGNHGDGVFVGANLTLVGGSEAGQRNIISDNWGNGITLQGDSSEIVGNYIGTDKTGTSALGNHAHGIYATVMQSAMIGGMADGSGNVISGNAMSGIWIDDESTGVTVIGNRIGTDAAGTAAAPNLESGIRVAGANHIIGNANWDGRNIISGNGGPGILVTSPVVGVKIQLNYIGTDESGQSALGNAVGIEVTPSSQPNGLLIGGSLYGEGNLIGWNFHEGLLLSGGAEVYGNLIGITGTTPIPNGGDGIRIRGDNNHIGTWHDSNSIAFNGGHGIAVMGENGDATGNFIDGNGIHDNAGLGIALAQDVVLPNDPGDSDSGDNRRQNYPLMTAAIMDPANHQATLTAELDSAPSTTYTIQFFINAACDPSGYGEGAQTVASKTAATDAGGHVELSITIDTLNFMQGTFFTARATDPANNTSEFSNCLPALMLPPTTPQPAELKFIPFVSPTEFFLGRCEPNLVDIAVEIQNPPEPVEYVLLFVRSMDPKSGARNPWSEGLSMIPAGPGKYRYTVPAADVPDADKFPDAILQYQFVAYNKAQAVIARSEVFGDVALRKCGGSGPAGVVSTPTPRGPHIGP